MSISAPEFNLPRAVAAAFTGSELRLELSDGRTLSVPISWYPRLVHATAQERANWKFTGGGEGLHWPDIEEDISVEGLIAGRPSRESQASLARWLSSRKLK